MSDKTSGKAAIYARVSTADQDLQRQLDECHDYLHQHYPDAIDNYADIISEASEDSGGEYERLWDENHC